MDELQGSRFALAKLAVIDDPHPHGAAWNMAFDEVLLASESVPVLRHYRWERPALSFGYFESLQHVASLSEARGRELIRRWTGGGVVLHGDDFTYSLVVPRAALPAGATAAACYAWIHGAVAGAMRRAGIIVTSNAAGKAARNSGGCFTNPVAADLLAGGRKVAGGAQRRTRRGLLYQGSIQGVDLPDGFAALLATAFASRTASPGDPTRTIALADELARTKYGMQEWMQD